MPNQLFYGDGSEIKNITFPQFGSSAWQFVTGDEDSDGKITESELYASVAAVFRAVNITATMTSGIPFAVMRGENDIDVSAEWKNVVGFMPNPIELIRLWRMSLFMTNTAYGFMDQGKGYKSLRYILPSTINPIVDASKGLTGFTRTVGTTQTNYPLDPLRIFHIWRLDHTTELLPSKYSEFHACMAAAGVLYWSDHFTNVFFKRGGVRQFFAFGDVPDGKERERIEGVITKLMTGASKFLAKVFNTQNFDIKQVGDGVESLAKSEIYQNKLSDIAIASGMPLSLLLANSSSYATAITEYKSWFDTTITPWCSFMAEAMNDRLFTPLGLHFEFRPEITDPGQEDEVTRAGAYKTYIDAGMLPSIAAQIVGLELPRGVEFEDLDPEEDPEPEPVPEQLQPDANIQPLNIEDELPSTDEEDDEEEIPAKWLPDLDQFRELELWQTMAYRKNKQGKAMAFDFEVKTLPADIASQIKAKLDAATDEQTIKAAFALDLHRDNRSIEALADAINRAVDNDKSGVSILDNADGSKSYSMPLPKPEVKIDMPQIIVNVPAQAAPIVNVQAAPAPIVNFTMPEIPAAQFTYNEVEQPAPVINVAAPQVTVQAELKQPKRKMKITRDNDGKMTGMEDL
jgi:hypothetical protein